MRPNGSLCSALSLNLDVRIADSDNFCYTIFQDPGNIFKFFSPNPSVWHRFQPDMLGSDGCLSGTQPWAVSRVCYNGIHYISFLFSFIRFHQLNFIENYLSVISSSAISCFLLKNCNFTRNIEIKIVYKGKKWVHEIPCLEAQKIQNTDFRAI